MRKFQFKIFAVLSVAVLLSGSLFAIPEEYHCKGDSITLKLPFAHTSVEWFHYGELITKGGVADTAPKVSPDVSTRYDAFVNLDRSADNLITWGDFESEPAGGWESVTDLDFYSGPSLNSQLGSVNMGITSISSVLNNPQSLFDSVTHASYVPNWYTDIADNTSGTGNMFVVNGTGSVDTIMKTNVTVAAGSEYLLSVCLANVAVSYDNPYNISVYIDGQAAGAYAGNEDGDWYNYNSYWVSTKTGIVDIVFVNNQTSSVGNDFAIDDILFAQVTKYIYNVNVVDCNASVELNDTAVDLTCNDMSVTLRPSSSYTTIEWYDENGILLTKLDNGSVVADTAPVVSPEDTTLYTAIIDAGQPGENLIDWGDFESTPAAGWESVTDFAYFPGPDPEDFMPDYNKGFFSVLHNADLLFDDVKFTGQFENWYASMTDHTSGSGNMFVANASTVEEDVIKASVSVTSGTKYVLSAWFANINVDYLNPPIVEVLINGEKVGTYNGPADGDWDKFYITWEATTTAIIDVIFKSVNSAASGNDFAIDDIVFAAAGSATTQQFLVEVEGGCTTGVESVEAAEIGIYPNPASEVLTISGLDSENASVQIFNISGVLVSVVNDLSAGSSISVDELVSGIYFAVVTTEKGAQTIRFCKE